MRVWLTVWTCLAVLIADASTAEEVVSALSQNRISITANFDGSEIFVFGAIKREAAPAEGRLGVIITVAGPLKRTIVRRKAKVLGIWANVDAAEVDAAPTFYAVASSAPLEEILKFIEDIRYRIRIEEKSNQLMQRLAFWTLKVFLKPSCAYEKMKVST